MIKKILILFLFLYGYSDKIKDITTIVGIRDNELIGYGLVVGLNGTGDGNSKTTTQSLASTLSSLNVKIDPKSIKSKNIASVVVTAKLPAFARNGDKLDVTISSIGSASSLEGGQLLVTSLKAVDGNIYAIASGAVSVGGKSSKSDKVSYHLTSAKIVSGATVEKEIKSELYTKKDAILSLKETNLNNAVAIQNAINGFFKKSLAIALDARTIKITKPQNLSMVEFLAKLQDININFTRDEKIIIDEKTGTIIAGIEVVIDPVVITHGDLTIKITPRYQMPQTTKTNKDYAEGIMVDQSLSLMFADTKKPTVANLTRALQKLGQTPKDIVAILLAMRKMGAIRVKIEVI